MIWDRKRNIKEHLNGLCSLLLLTGLLTWTASSLVFAEPVILPEISGTTTQSPQTPQQNVHPQPSPQTPQTQSPQTPQQDTKPQSPQAEAPQKQEPVQTPQIKLNTPQMNWVLRKGTGAVSVKWGKIAGAKGYEIQYAANAKFTGSGVKTVKVKKGSKTAASITGVSKKKDTYIRMRAYSKSGRATSYSKWSASVRLAGWKSKWTYASASAIHTNQVTLYYSPAQKPKKITVAINAGHGTRGGSSYRTLCHPDGTPKVTGGSTAQGAVYATADNEGTLMGNGTPEAVYTLRMALRLKDKLLAKGYNVLMLRQDDDSGLDVIGRTVFANNLADCHIAIHYDSSSSNKGAFYCSVPDNASYRNMTPVKQHWSEHIKLGESLIKGLRAKGVRIWSSGAMATDLMQTSFSTVPSVDIEMGDKATPTSDAVIDQMAEGLLKGVQYFFG